MDRGHENYCIADAMFYDDPTRARDDDVDFAVAETPLPPGWSRVEFEDWLAYAPADAPVPSQGWKVHVSASLAQAPSTLATVYDYCIAHRLAFKYVRSAQLLLLANGKYADRGSSGKFITMYPVDDADFERVVTDLEVLLTGRAGPYILNDLRIGDGPVYVRYGGFSERWCIGPNGDLVPAVEQPDGELVPDLRGATFQPPAWVDMPNFLTPHLLARTSTTIADLPFRIQRPLHFSNGGGVYLAEDTRTGAQVVLKEARPHAGLAMDGADAVARLRRERDMLGRLSGLGIVPEVVDSFSLGGHEFLALEFVEGQALSNTLVDRYPLAVLGDNVDLAGYTSWALEMHAKVSTAVEAAHGRGVVIGDLHPFNVLVGSDGRVTLIDLEIASLVEEGRRPTLGDPAFAAPRPCVGFDIDRYALACLRLFMFLPLTELISLHPDKAGQFAADICDEFPVPVEFVAAAVRTIAGLSSVGETVPEPAWVPRGQAWPELDGDPASWKSVRDSLAGAILASATPERTDRLFPGDVRQFEFGGLNLAYGAAGVLYALSATGAGTRPEHEQWLVRQARSPQPGNRFGLYDGLHGVAWALDRLGRRDDALAVLDICVDTLDGAWDQLGTDLFGGLAGIGLNVAYFAEQTGDAALWTLAGEIVELLADELGDEQDVPALSGGRHPHAGLTRGSSGPALLFLRAYERSRDPALLEFAATALRQDLRRCILRDDGALEVDEGYRTMPYLADGSVGIGMVLEQYLRYADDDRFAVAAAQIRVAASSQFYIEPGLFSGRAGMILHLGSQLRDDVPTSLVAGHVQRLGWHAIGYRGQLAFPGEQLLRLSMDLATGTAGVLLGLGAAWHDEPVELPLCGPVGRDRAEAERR